jgi:hypothetical protein
MWSFVHRRWNARRCSALNAGLGSGLVSGLGSGLGAGLVPDLGAGLVSDLCAGLVSDLGAGLVSDLGAGPGSAAAGRALATTSRPRGRGAWRHGLSDRPFIAPVL